MVKEHLWHHRLTPLSARLDGQYLRRGNYSNKKKLCNNIKNKPTF